jgi:hypothetical protein
MTAPRVSVRADDRGIDRRLALAGAIVVGLVLIWLVARAASPRGGG